ncbi:MAG: NfeD family protein [Clostridia bacterium]|nr:NfeD family protein [Clostridia bacterium]
MWYIWLIIAGVAFIAEIFTTGFLVFWFGLGALISMIVSIFCPGDYVLQTSIFVITSTLLIFLTKPLVNKFTKKDKNKEYSTNAYSIVGKKGIVVQDINPVHGIGQVKVAGEVWSAKTSDDSIIEKGSQIEVTEIQGVKAVVKSI